MVASVAANPDVTNVNLDISPAIVPGYNNYSVCFHINTGLGPTHGIFITFDESTMVDEDLEDDCITVSYNGTTAHPEIREIIHNPDPEYEQYDFPDDTTTVKMSVPFDIQFNNDVCVNFTCGIFNDCPCGPHHVWVNTDLEMIPVISNDVDMDVTITADVIAGDGSIYSPQGCIAPPEFSDIWDCGDSPCYTIVPATGGNITNVWVDGVSVIDDLIWYPNGSAQYCFTPLTCSYELTAEFEGPPIGSISGYKIDAEGNGLSDWTMTLSNETTDIDETVTDDEGFYSFSGLPFGTYAVTEDLKEGYVNVTPISQGDLVIDEENPDIEDVDFINQEWGSISGYKFDTEGNGLPGWEMTLSNETTDIDETETDADGFYIFSGLPFATYAVTEELEDGYANITPLSQGDLVIDSETPFIEDVDFINEELLGNISGYKLDHEGYGLADWVMILSNETAEVTDTMTDESGFYRFTGLPFGTYTVTEVLQIGYTNITPLSQDNLVIDEEQMDITDVNFTNRAIGNISGYKLDDLGNPLAGWTINLYDDIGLIRMYLTGSDGYYQFIYLPFGAYEVDETLQPGWILIDPEGGYYAVDITEANTTFENLNFTNQKECGNISGYKLDIEGIGISGWEMTLSNETAVFAETGTDEEGFYIFTFVPFGTYSVTEELREGYFNITPLSQGNLIIDEENRDIIDVNFINNPTSISGYKLDNATGLGIPGWEIVLFNESSEIAETITDEYGFYVFSGVPFGTYTVEEELETGWMNVTPLSVGNLTLNETNPVIGDVNFINERMTGSINGWAGSHCNIGSLRVPGIKVCVALTPEDLGTENSWCNVTDTRGIYYIPDLPTGVPLYAMATAPGYELRPISYQINTGHVIICNDFSTTPKIPALVAENTTQVNWFLVKSPFFLPFF